MQRLVKAYQEEIDALAKRSRASDSAFFSLYKALYEAPDPAQALGRMASERPRAAASEVNSRTRWRGAVWGRVSVHPVMMAVCHKLASNSHIVVRGEPGGSVSVNVEDGGPRGT